MKKLFAAVLLLALFGCSYSAKQMEPLNKPDPNIKYENEGNTSRYTSQSFVVEASYLSPEKADLYFSIYKDGKYKNPFLPSMMVFLLSIENKGKKTANFNPALAWVYPDKGNPSTAKDYTSFYADLEIVDADDIEERIEAYKASSFDGAETIPPGSSVKKLIVFMRANERVESGGLILESVYCGKVCENVKLLFPGGLGKY
jgi:hypothetical protein